jgi:AmiR/NasT family two-component response regulator
VEDEAISALEIRESLELWGYTVVSIANTGEKAIQEALVYKPDLILMDITLKGEMDGIDAATIIKTFLDVPLIYLTGLDDLKIFSRVNETDANAYLTKPIQEVELRNNVSLALKTYQKHKEELQEHEKAGLEDVQLFMRSALPELAANMSIVDRSVFLGRFMKVFEKNMKPLFHKHSQKYQNIYEELSDEDKLKIYLSWVTQLYQHIGFQVQTRAQETSGIITVKKCAWAPVKPQDIFLCLICQSIMQLTYSWTKLPGNVQSEETSGVLNSVCFFDFNREALEE